MKKQISILSVIFLLLLVQIINWIEPNYLLAGPEDAIDIHGFPNEIAQDIVSLEKTYNSI